MSHASRSAHIADLIDDLADLYLAQVADLREFAQATEAGEGTMHLEDALRHREIRRADLYRQFEQAAFSPPPIPVVAPNELDLSEDNLMHSVYRRASANLYVRVEQTALLYKEGPELPRQPWSEQPAASPELFRLGPGAARNLPAGECGVAW
jgi:hypothetical protein